MSAFALPIPPAYLSIHLLRLTERSPTVHSTFKVRAPAASVHDLSPVTSSAQADLISELLRFL